MVYVPTDERPGPAFGTIAVSGQSNVVADSSSDTLTIAAGANVTVTTNATTDTVTIAATGGSYTDEQAQDAVGGMLADTATIDFTYTDATPSITASVKSASITEAMQVLADNTTNNVTASAHGYAPKAPSDSTKFLNGANPPAYAVPAGTSSFGTVAVSGQSDVVADAVNDTLTLVAGSNVTITTNASTDTVTIAAAAAGSSFGTVAVSGQSDVVADSANDTLTFVAGANVTLTTSAGGDSVTIAASGSGSLLVKLFDTTLGSDTATIDTGAAGIAGGYDVLEVWVIGRTDEVVVGSQLSLTFNADTGANYDWQRVSGINTVASAAPASAQTAIALVVAGASSAANVAGIVRISIPAYTQTTFYKAMEYTGSLPDTSVNKRAETFTAQWRNTAAITRAAITPTTAAKLLKTGSRMIIYGR